MLKAYFSIGSLGVWLLTTPCSASPIEDISPTGDKDWIVVATLNAATPTELNQVLDSTILGKIQAFRVGTDGKEGTSDDRYFASPSQLAEVQKLDSDSVDALHSYGLAKWGEDPFSPLSCVGQPLRPEIARTWIPLPLDNEQSLGSFEGHLRRRLCYAGGHCRQWETVSESPTISRVGLVIAETGSLLSTPKLNDPHTLPPLRGEIVLELRKNSPRLILVSEPSDEGLRLYNFNSLEWSQSNLSPLVLVDSRDRQDMSKAKTGELASFELPGLNYFQFTSRLVTASCLRYRETWKDNHTDDKDNSIYWENELVLLGNISPTCAVGEKAPSK